ncbi:MAG: adenosine deaminase [Anaerolineales bacterium]|nr:adenosine deaminase [Anaerolineales bacterium]
MTSHSAEFYHSLPKVELHRHLEGSLRLSTLVEIARDYDIDIPGFAGLRPLVQIGPSDAHTAENFLSKFEVLRNFYRSPQIIKRITEEAIADAALDNIRYLELRFTPVALGKAAGFPVDEVLDWVIEAVEGTQGKHGITTRLLVSVNRHESLELAEQVALQAVDRLDSAIIGLDLAGDEAQFPSAPFEPIFREARQSGLKITIHAGEWGPAENIAQAIEYFEADRIGHGVRVMEDPRVVALARELGTTFEVCLTSNYQSGVVADLDQHPIQKMIASGLDVTINTDDPGISQITLSDEYSLLCERIGMSQVTLQERVTAAARAAFLPADEREALEISLEEEFNQLNEPC